MEKWLKSKGYIILISDKVEVGLKSIKNKEHISVQKATIQNEDITVTSIYLYNR